MPPATSCVCAVLRTWLATLQSLLDNQPLHAYMPSLAGVSQSRPTAMLQEGPACTAAAVLKNGALEVPQAVLSWFSSDDVIGRATWLYTWAPNGQLQQHRVAISGRGAHQQLRAAGLAAALGVGEGGAVRLRRQRVLAIGSGTVEQEVVAEAEGAPARTPGGNGLPRSPAHGTTGALGGAAGAVPTGAASAGATARTPGGSPLHEAPGGGSGSVPQDSEGGDQEGSGAAAAAAAAAGANATAQSKEVQRGGLDGGVSANGTTPLCVVT